ncbi:hypothetical protein [Rhizobium leguminosarum]|uniref:hypothetical protein n=1 Tax=Rhizobium leguminosarum TaxID=384 RepID=UPI002E11FF69|nr:hypothetical protein U8Q02_05980 [Rhizobium leguminosarum]
MIKEMLTWETNSTLTYPGKDNRVMRFREDWRPIRLILTKYEAVSSVKSFDTEFSLDELPGEDWKPLTEEAQKKYRELRKAEIKTAKDPVAYRISGRAQFADRDTVTVGEVAGYPDKQMEKVQTGFRKTFDKVHVTIAAGDQDVRDHFRFIANSEHLDEELYFGAVIQKDKMRQLMADIRLSKELPPLELSIKVLLFEDQIDSWTSTWRGRRNYFLPAAPGWGHAILVDASIKWGEQEGYFSHEENQKIDESMGIYTPERRLQKTLQNLERGVWTLITVVIIVACSFYFRR